MSRAFVWLVAAAFVVLHPLEAAAEHHRITSEHGPIHVWKPVGYDATTAGVVVYVHGYFTSVDRAWKQHRLAKQFAASKINALFIACGAPDDWRSPVRWESIDELLAAVATTDEIPAGRVVVVGHSGAHRTLKRWLSEDRIDTIVLVDALYGGIEEFKQWLDGAPERRLIDAAALTSPWTEKLHALLPDTLLFEKFPRARDAELAGARDARVVYVRSQLDHMGLVTSGVAIPMLLRAVTLPAVVRPPRTPRR